MVNIAVSPILRRKTRLDPLEELGVGTGEKVKEAIAAGRTEEACDLVDLLRAEGIGLHDTYLDWIYHQMTFIADRLGEEEMFNVLMDFGRRFRGGATVAAGKYPMEQVVVMLADAMRAHPGGPGELGSLKIVEERDRYVMTFDPCGSGGRVRRGPQDGKRPARTGPPFNFGTTKQPWPWSWGKVGVPYYCIHCCAWSEILSTELNGWPFRVTLYQDDPQAPCGWALYKHPNLIPEEYFTRIGVQRDPAKFKVPPSA